MAYAPQMMPTLMLYSHCLEERSSRDIRKTPQVGAAHQVIVGKAEPDHTPLCGLRAWHEVPPKGTVKFGKTLRPIGGGAAPRITITASVHAESARGRPF